MEKFLNNISRSQPDKTKVSQKLQKVSPNNDTSDDDNISQSYVLIFPRTPRKIWAIL